MELSKHETEGLFEQEIREGQRFEFGRNWQAFLSTLDDERILVAKNSLTDMLGLDDLHDKTFLDAGSGSGLFSLTARSLGAQVHSFDFDPSSVACTRELCSRYFPNDPNWIIEQGSVLDKEFLRSLGLYDIVYSWGVLHHTGSMWEALENAGELVKPNGLLFVAIYGDQGLRSKFWWRVKKLYCSSAIGKMFVSTVFVPYFALRALIKSIVTRENVFATYKKNRGMSIVHDWIDWLGGLPFEVATVKEIEEFYKAKGFSLIKLVDSGGGACNEFVFANRVDQSST